MHLYLCVYRNKSEKKNTKLCCSLGSRISRELLHYTSLYLLMYFWDLWAFISQAHILRLYFFCLYCCWIKSLKVGSKCYTYFSVCFFNQKNNKTISILENNKTKKFRGRSLAMFRNLNWGMQVTKQYFTYLILVHLIYYVYSKSLKNPGMKMLHH